MANYMAAIGRGGNMMDATLIETTAKIQNKITNLNKIDVKYIVECLTGVTSEKDGTLYNVFKGFPYKVAAKTGTAQKSGYINEESEVEYLRKYLHLIASDVLWEDMLCEAERLQNKYPDVYETQDMAVRRAVINLSKYDVDYEDIDRYKEKYDNFAWTVALAPAEDPQIAVAVMIVQGKSSLNAAPAVREIIGNYGDITGWEKLF
jgi:penicillin-binding protein 2